MKLATIAALAKALGGGSSGGGGSGGDNGFFDITITDWDAQTIDKTYAEIVAAISAGKTIRVIDQDGAHLATTTQGSSLGIGNYVRVYPFWFDVELENTVELSIYTTRITVLESGSVSFGYDSTFTISGENDT